MAQNKATKRTKRVTKKATPKSAASAAAVHASPKVRAATQQQVLEAAAAHLASKFRRPVVSKMDELDTTVPGWVSTQSLALDWVCDAEHGRGLPLSRIVDVTGEEGVGKSTIADHVMAEFQRRGFHAHLWDTENARDTNYQRKVGIVRSKAGQIDADSMEEGFDVMTELISWHVANDPDRPGVIVWDTPAGTPTAAELDEDKTNERFGPAKIIKAKLRRLNVVLRKSNWLLLIVNQLYNGQTPSGQAYKVAYGGSGIPYFASVRLTVSHPSKFWRTNSEKEMGQPPLGQTVYVKCVKNRVAPPHRSRQIAVEYGVGISNVWDVFNTLEGAGAIKQAGGWYSFDPAYDAELARVVDRKFQGGYLGLGSVIASHEDRTGLWKRLMSEHLKLNKPVTQEGA